jgi:myo-inositol 2-dehydrogenase / D-chiro-inositol 1-dehydrogenase
MTGFAVEGNYFMPIRWPMPEFIKVESASAARGRRSADFPNKPSAAGSVNTARLSAGNRSRPDPVRMPGDGPRARGIGRVLMCHGIRHSGEGLPRNIPWYHDRTKSGDMLTDQGIHILDLFRWAIGGHPLRAYGVGGINLFKNEPPGRTSMDGYSVIYEFPNGVYINFSHHYYDPPRFTGTWEKVFGSDGSADLVKGSWQPREKRETIQLDIPDAKQDSTYIAMLHFVDCARNGKQPVNNVDSAIESTLQALLGTKAIYERRVVTWEEVAGA